MPISTTMKAVKLGDGKSSAAIKLPQYEQTQGYKSQREVDVRRTYREMMGE